ncbi:MAG TPA: winged helix-turn-helix transcriptional regulator [Phycisphaerae bacterium]|nr:winged helix-turn-helix transcriptional regulator [Phycisphaerae bacterium]HRW51803.1 winged helix-turn-helix transcriptional regulator [Phycisphaerae bacterium]
MTGRGVIDVGAEPPPLDAPKRAASRGADRQGRPGRSKPKRRRATADRFATLNAFVDLSLRELRRPDIAVWLILFRDTRNGTARTGQTDIARRAGISARTVRRSIGRLKAAGLLRIVKRGGPNAGPSVYAVVGNSMA